MLRAKERTLLGIDPGLATVGYAVLKVPADGDVFSLALLSCGAITTASTLAFEKRLQFIYEAVQNIIQTYHPQESAVEQVFFGKNRKTAMHIGQSRGVVLLALAQSNISLHEFTPTEMKRLVVNDGRAKKAVVGERVRALLRLSTVPRPDDAADAVALALCLVL